MCRHVLEALLKEMDKLCSRLGEIFTDDIVDTEEVTRVLEDYKSNWADWGRFAQFDQHK
jgi:hypothetical protein